METDSVCISWIPSEEQYIISILKNGELIREQAQNMTEVIQILRVIEDAA